MRNFSKIIVTYLLAALVMLIPLKGQAGAFEDAMQAYDVRDYTKSAELYRLAAEGGHALAQNNLGMMYASGKGVELSAKQAAFWLGKAAEQGIADAQYYLGILYQRGVGVPESAQRAAELFRLSADQGHAEAQYSLGFSYFYGQGLPQSREVALIWLRKSAALGYLPARDQLIQLGIE